MKLAYDLLNRVTNMVDSLGTTHYTYDAAGQLLTSSGPFSSDTLTNTYSNRRRVALALQEPSGHVWTNGFGWDLAARLTSVASPAGAFAYAYTALDSTFSGRLVQELGLPSGAYITNFYDPVARLVGTVLESSGSSALDAALYGCNEGNERTAYTNAAGAYDLYTYDPIGQLKVGTSSTVSEDRGYGYDAAWNLNYLTNNGSTITYSVDGQNQLTAVGGTPCLYDANGNLVRAGSATSGMYLTYTYDDENRLTEVATNYAAIQEPQGGVPALLVSNPWKSDLVYDGLGRLRKRLEYVNGTLQTTTLYLYDGWRVIQERDGNDNPTVSYTRGPDLSGSLEGAGGIGGLLARSSGYSSGNWTSHAYYHADGNGNITCLINASQSVVASYRYDPYGNTLSQSGTLAVANVYRFSSKEVHTNSLMYYFGYRFYDPGLQRWPNRDPLADYGSAVYAVGRIERRVEPRTSDEIAAMADARRDQLRVFTRINLNLYNAVGNDPTDQGDPEGLDYGFWNGLWDEFTDPDGYTACYAKCMAGISTAADFGAELGGSTAAARRWYTWKYPKWFKAGGKYSKKLVPKLAGKISACLAPLAIKDAWDCYQECKDRQ